MANKPGTAMVAAPTTLSTADLMATLQQSGMVQTSQSTFRRMRLDNGVLVAYDSQGEVVEQFPPRYKGKEPLPAVTLRIVEPPVYYNAFWLGAEFDDKGQPTGATDPNRIGRPDLNKTFSKHYDDPNKQAEDKNPSNEVYDLLCAATGSRGGFKADVQVQIVPDSGELTGDEPIYTLTLSSSSALDWRGTRKNPTGGTVQEKNFIVQLAEMAVEQAVEAGADAHGQQKAVLDAMTALRLGGVVADTYLLRDQNTDGSRSWTVIAFKPVHIEFPETVAALSDPEVNSDDIGF